MTSHQLLIYSVTVFVASIIPGPSMLLALHHGSRYGYKKSIYTAMGNVAATFFQGIVSIAGLQAVLLCSENLFTVIRYIGAVYLIYLGLAAIFAKENNEKSYADNKMHVKRKSLFSEAFIVTCGNPKAILFFTALFPQFIPSHDAGLSTYVLIVGILLAATFVCMILYSAVGSKLSALLHQGKIRKYFNKTVGAFFVGIGVDLILRKA